MGGRGERRAAQIKCRHDAGVKQAANKAVCRLRVLPQLAIRRPGRAAAMASDLEQFQINEGDVIHVEDEEILDERGSSEPRRQQQ